jgi:hypothetical protein
LWFKRWGNGNKLLLLPRATWTSCCSVNVRGHMAESSGCFLESEAIAVPRQETNSHNHWSYFDILHVNTTA